MKVIARCAVLLCLASLACTSESLEFADWTIPVPEGAAVIEYAPVPMDERTERIELVEDLVIGERGDDPNYAFYRPDAVDADSEGRICVLDGGNNRVQVFSPAGEYLRTLGGPGSGPGEFGSEGGWSQFSLIISDDRVLVFDGMQSKIATWDAEGTLLDDISIAPTRFVHLLAVLADGSNIAEVREYEDAADGARVSYSVLGRFSANGELMNEYLRLLVRPNLRIGRIGIPSPSGAAHYVATNQGTLFVTGGDEYQLLAINADGDVRWAMRVAHERQPFTATNRDDVLEMIRQNVPDLDASGTAWPTQIGAISDLLIDGHGHLYVKEFVFPYPSPPAEIAVDVYSPDGERLFAGHMPNVRWTGAEGDFVYATRRNAETEEEEVVRYRLVEPF